MSHLWVVRSTWLNFEVYIRFAFILFPFTNPFHFRFIYFLFRFSRFSRFHGEDIIGCRGSIYKQLWDRFLGYVWCSSFLYKAKLLNLLPYDFNSNSTGHKHQPIQIRIEPFSIMAEHSEMIQMSGNKISLLPLSLFKISVKSLFSTLLELSLSSSEFDSHLKDILKGLITVCCLSERFTTSLRRGVQDWPDCVITFLTRAV